MGHARALGQTRGHCVGDRSFARRPASSCSLLAGLAAYLCLWPVPAEPVAWQAQTPPGFTGAFAPNTRLAGLRMIDIGGEVGPEHIAIGPDGKLYAAMMSGNLIRMEPDGGKQEVFANTGGRVLGFDFDAQGRMIAADAMKGLLAIGTDGRVTLLTDRVSANDPIGYANSVVVAPDGTIYFTRFIDALPARAMGRHLSGERARHPGAIRDRPCARLRSGDRDKRASWRMACPSPTGSRWGPTATLCLSNETGRYRLWKIDGSANDLNVQSGSPQAQGAARQSAGLSGQPDARTRRPHLGRAVQAAQSGGGQSRRQAVHAKGAAAPAAVDAAARRSRTGTSSPSTRTAASSTDLQDPSGAYPETTGRHRDRRPPLHPQPACARHRLAAAMTYGIAQTQRTKESIMHNGTPAQKKLGFRIHALAFVPAIMVLLIVNVFHRLALLGAVGGAGLGHRPVLPLVFCAGPGRPQTETDLMRGLIAAAVKLVGAVMALSACATAVWATAAAQHGSRARGDLHSPQHQRAASTRRWLVLCPRKRDLSRSQRTPSASTRSGVLRVQPEDGRVVETKSTARCRTARLLWRHGRTAAAELLCRNHIGRAVVSRQRRVPRASKIDFPEAGLFPVRCQLILSGLPAPYVGGLLTTNTMTSRAAFGGDTDPPGYTQASIATIRLWKSK